MISLQLNRRLFWCLLSTTPRIRVYTWQLVKSKHPLMRRIRKGSPERKADADRSDSRELQVSIVGNRREPSKFVDEEADCAKTQKSRAAARCTGCEVQKPKCGSLHQ